jgi:predicted dehydrogenase
MGIIGFIDTDTVLSVPGTRLVAAADCYDGRLERATEVYGRDVFTTRDYRELLARDDVDAVLVCTPDHWHAQMAIDALEAGKAVYCEKPMVQDIEEGPAVIEAQKRTGLPLQVGSQFASDLVYLKARELYQSGAIGTLNLVEASYNRNSSLGAWQYSIPPDATPERVDWDRFLGNAPKRSFDAVRFFRWRNYQDYGTGVAGDLFVHLFTGIHTTLSAVGPARIAAQGGLRIWKDGRDVPDVFLGLFDYEESEAHPPFNLVLQTTFADGGGSGSYFRFIGSEGVIEANSSSVTVKRSPRMEATEERVLRGYNSVRTFSTPVQEEFARIFRAERVPARQDMAAEQTFRVPDGYDARNDHFANFVDALRGDAAPVEDPAFGYRAAAPPLLANKSYFEEKLFKWDPLAMKVVA